MHSQHATQQTIARPETAAPVLRGRGLVLARSGWAALVALNLAIFAAAMPVLHAQRGAPPETVRAELARLGIPEGLYAAYFTALLAAFGLGCFAVAAVIARRRSDDPMALLGSVFLVLMGAVNAPNVQVLAAAYPEWGSMLKFSWWLLWAALILFVFLFPDGRFVPRWTRGAVGVLILGTFVALFFGRGTLTEPPPALGLILVGALLAGVAAQIYRYRNVSSPKGRQQTKWVISGITAAILVQVLGILATPLFAEPGAPAVLYNVADDTVITLAYFLIPLSIGAAILRFRLWDIDLIINRALVYGALTACVIGLYVMVVGAAGALLQARGNLLLSLLATGLVAVLFAPLKDRLQRGVDRLMYGERDEPYTVLSRLGQRLEATLAPEAALSTIVETVAGALKLPYAAITLKQNGKFAITAEHGIPPEEPILLPLSYGAEVVGQLVLAQRSLGEPFSSADNKLLGDLARQAGAAVHAVRLAADLQRSREQIVTAREEERRRIRRDLHDGLGPRLAAHTLKAGSARSLYPRDPAAADALLSELEADMEGAISEVRRLVHDLRPPALDELGLVGAIRETATRYGTRGLGISIQASQAEAVPPLPAAVEVAAYRVAQEALTNVVRHARATACLVRVSPRNGVLDLEVSDDGVGLPDDRTPGVGLSSMRERAEELGGTCEIQSIPSGGTRVVARLPLPEENAEGG